MKRLLLLRHAKAGWDNPAMRDFDRSLTDEGQRAASRMGRLFKEERLDPGLVIASPSARTRQTVEGFARGFGQPLTPVWDERIYMATMDTLLELIHGLDEASDQVMLVGHNPGLEDLALALAGSGDKADLAALAHKFPTAALAVLGFEGDHWRAINRGEGTLERFTRPRQLDQLLDDS